MAPTKETATSGEFIDTNVLHKKKKRGMKKYAPPSFTKDTTLFILFLFKIISITIKKSKKNKTILETLTTGRLSNLNDQ